MLKPDKLLQFRTDGKKIKEKRLKQRNASAEKPVVRGHVSQKNPARIERSRGTRRAISSSQVLHSTLCEKTGNTTHLGKTVILSE